MCVLIGSSFSGTYTSNLNVKEKSSLDLDTDGRVILKCFKEIGLESVEWEYLG